jgi:hypothetical protein
VKIANKWAATKVDIPLNVETGVKNANYSQAEDAPRASFTFAPGAVSPGKKVTFDASSSVLPGGASASYQWLFGDGTAANGVRVRHVFPDSLGTLLDGSGRFRVLLKVTDAHGRTDWASHPVVATRSLQRASKVHNATAGVTYRYYEGDWSQLPDFEKMTPALEGTAAGFNTSVRKRPDHYGLVFDGYLEVPTDGGYTFTLLSRDGGRLEIGSQVVATSPAPMPQVCGSVGNMVQEVKDSLGLKKGMHTVRVSMTNTTGEDAFALRWEGPGIELSDVPPGVLFHSSAGVHGLPSNFYLGPHFARVY